MYLWLQSPAQFSLEVILMSISPIPIRPPARPRHRLLHLPHRRFLPACLALALFPLSIACQTSTLAPPPPPPLPAPTQPASPAVIARVTAAKTIFLSNAGGNDPFTLEIPGGPDVAYNELYAALQQWGYFQLVDSPAHADLIFQIRGTELAPELVQTPDNQHIIARQHAPKLVLTILSPSDPTPIDTITTLAGRGTNIPKGTIAFAQSIEWLTYQISTRVSAPRADSGKLLNRDALRPSFESLVHFTAPVPPQVLHAKNIFLVDDTVAPPSAPHRSFENFTTALTTWAFYHLADSAQSADLVLHYHHDEANGTWLTLEDPHTKLILWTITDPHHGFYHQDGAHRAAALNQNLVSELKLLNHIPLTQAETAALH
jgi:hypothetical protein